MDRKLTIEEAAAEFVDEYGEEAVEVLKQRAKEAAELGDEIAAETWRKAAESAERQLRSGC